jgi:hypothetical protein
MKINHSRFLLLSVVSTLLFPAWTSQAQAWRFGVFGDVRSGGKERRTIPWYPRPWSTPLLKRYRTIMLRW